MRFMSRVWDRNICRADNPLNNRPTIPGHVAKVVTRAMSTKMVNCSTSITPASSPRFSTINSTRPLEGSKRKENVRVREPRRARPLGTAFSYPCSPSSTCTKDLLTRLLDPSSPRPSSPSPDTHRVFIKAPTLKLSRQGIFPPRRAAAAHPTNFPTTAIVNTRRKSRNARRLERLAS